MCMSVYGQIEDAKKKLRNSVEDRRKVVPRYEEEIVGVGSSKYFVLLYNIRLSQC